jgi:hypothetical protein
MEQDQDAQLRDDGRCESALQAIKDVLWRFEEMGEGTYSIYDLLGYLFEDLVEGGCCAACIHQTLVAVCKERGADLEVHREDGEVVYH